MKHFKLLVAALLLVIVLLTVPFVSTSSADPDGDDSRLKSDINWLLLAW